MILDLTNKNNLDESCLELFKKNLNSNIGSFHRAIASISAVNNQSIDWWSSSPFSRNTIVSPLFDHFCTIKLVETLIEMDKFTGYDKILVDSNALKTIIEKKINQHNFNIIVENITSPINHKIWIPIKLLLKIFRELLRKSYQLFCARKTRHLCSGLNNKKLILVEKYIFPGFILKERFFNGLWENLGNQQKSITYFVPTIVMIQIKNMLRTYKELRLSDKNFFIKEDYIQFRDLLFAIGHFWRVLKLKVNKENHDIASLFHEELKNFRNYSSAVESLLNYCFVKRIKEQKVKLRLVISWFENQDVDKGWNFGFNTFYPEVNSIGYRGLVPAKLYLSQMYPTDFEQKNNILPKVVCVTGKGFAKPTKTYAPGLDVKEAPAFRFQHLWNGIPHAPNKNTHTILIALPITFNDSVHIIEQMIACTVEKSIKTMRFWIKPHPTMPVRRLKRKFGAKWPKSFVFTEFNTKKALRKADILVSGMSSICLEAMALGVPVLVIKQHQGLQYNPIPDELEQDLCKYCGSRQEILDGIELYRDRNDAELARHKELGLQIRETYFKPVTQAGVLQLLGIS